MNKQQMLEIRINIVILITFILGNVCEIMTKIISINENWAESLTGVLIVISLIIMITDNKIANKCIECFKDGAAFHICGLLSVVVSILNYWGITDGVYWITGVILIAYIVAIAVVVCIKPKHIDGSVLLTILARTLIIASFMYALARCFLSLY